MVLPVLLVLQWAAAAAATATAPSRACAANPGRRASCYTQRWLSPPHSVPSGSSTDGPVIGNGDMGVVATGNAGIIQLYTGKNDFWSTRDVPSGGCAYALMGSGSLEISTPQQNPSPTPAGPPGGPMNCTVFGCTCQGFANYYGAVAGKGWGCAPQPAGKSWWSQHNCHEQSKAGYCIGPACELPGHHPCDPPVAPGPDPEGGSGVWNASQDLQSATINVSALIPSTGLRIETTSFVAVGENVMLTTLSVTKDTTLSFKLLFAVGSEGHATRASVHDGTPVAVGETAFRDRNFASVMPCSASDIIEPAVRIITLDEGSGMLQVRNGTVIGCLVLYDGTDEVVHEPVPAACKSYGDAAKWQSLSATSGAVELQNMKNKSACLVYGNGTPTDFGSRRVFAGECGGSSSWVLDSESRTIAASSKLLFEQPGQRQCLTAAPPNVNNTLVHAVDIFSLQSGAVPFAAMKINPDGSRAAAASVTWECVLKAGVTYSLALTSLTKRDVGGNDPLAASLALARSAVRNSTALRVAHQKDWDSYWSTCASVDLGQRQLLEGWWFGSQYLFKSATALGKVPPGLWGPWVTGTSRAAWGGDFTLDYNFQANFWGAGSSNHPELIMPYVDTILRLLPLGRARAQAPDWHTARGFFGPAGQHNQGMQCGASPTGWAGPLGQCPASAGLGNYSGVNFPGHMGPWAGQEFPTDMGIRSIAAFAWTPLMQMFDTTQDKALLKDKVYPYLRGIVDFYINPDPAGRSYLVTGRDGKLHVPYSCGDEICHDEFGEGVDPMEDMGFVRMALQKAIAYSAVLGVDEDLRPRWGSTLKNMAPFRTTLVNGVKVFAQSASFTTDWNATNETAGWPGSKTVYTGYPIIYDSGIHPADVITRSSDPELLQVARNTIWTDGQNVQWNPTNGFVLSWIPAARIVERSNSSELLDGFEAAVRTSVYTNWYHPHGGGGYEDVGAVEAINSMLLLSIEGGMRFFPAWPIGEAASFQNLRASGAFVVNASVDATGSVTDVRMLAEVGGRCVFLCPWIDEGTDTYAGAPKVSCAGVAVPVTPASGPVFEQQQQRAGEKWFQFDTKPGDVCMISPK